MSSEVNLISFIITSIVGIACGALVGFAMKWPKSIGWLIAVAILAGLSPWTMNEGWFVKIQVPKGSLIGVHIGCWLTFFCATVIVAFGVRLMKARKVAMNETL